VEGNIESSIEEAQKGFSIEANETVKGFGATRGREL